MSLFIVFILAAVLLGAGAMLSPAWHTSQPRVSLSAAFCLALVMGGAVFYAEAFGWDTLVVDYLLFALLSGVVLGGTLSTAQARAEARGEHLADRDLGWPGPKDLAFFALVALVVLIPLLHLPASLGDQGQIAAMHSLGAREGESFNSLAPFYPDSHVIVSPGLHALTAYLSQQLGHSIPLIQLSMTAVVVFLLVWLAYDLGAELRDKRLGRAMAVATLCCAGLQHSYLDGHFAELLALLFMTAFLLFALRLARKFNPADMIAGGLMMGAVIYTSLSLSLIMLLGFATLCVLVWLKRFDAPESTSRWGLTIGLPLVALIGIAPWLVNNLPLMLPIKPSPFPADLSYFAEMTRGQGLVIVVLALWGMWLGLRERGIIGQISLLMLIWLLLTLEFSLFGVIGRLLQPLGEITHAPNLARHGVILPFTWFGGIALLQLWDAKLPPALKIGLRKSAYPLMALTGTVLVLMGTAFHPLLNALRPMLDLPPMTVTRDDAAAMTWLRDNTAKDARLLSADGAGWLPVFAERRALDFRAVAYFEWDALDNAGRVDEDFDYVFVPAGADVPTSMPLDLVFEQGGARVYEVVADDAPP